MNKVGQNQDRLITLVEFKNDLVSNHKEEPTSEKKRPDMTFLKFSPCLERFESEPPNFIPSKSYKRRK